MNKTGRTAVIGDKDGNLAFKAVGTEVFHAMTAAEAGDILRRLVKEEYAVIYISDILCVGLQDILLKLKARPYPIVIPIPTAKGSSGFSMNSMKHDAEKAIGADIVFNK
jgi:V/A-type H+-transporting ATPase subunit F